MTRRTKQGGSIVNFIIVGVVLAVGLVSAVYLVNIRGDQVRRDQSTVAGNQQAPAGDNKKPREETSKPDESDNNTTPPDDNESKPKDNDQEVTQVPPTGAESVDNSQTLPVTGPELSIIEYIAVYLLATTSCVYLLSRRHVKHSL